MIYSLEDFIVYYLVGGAITLTLVLYLTFDFVFFAMLVYIHLADIDSEKKITDCEILSHWTCNQYNKKESRGEAV